MKKINLKIPQVQLQKIKMVDCGNVNELDSLEQLIRELTTSLPHSMIVVVGGTEEMNIAALKGIGCDAVRYLKIDSSLDMKPACIKQDYKDAPIVTNQLHHLSYFRMIVEDS